MRCISHYRVCGSDCSRDYMGSGRAFRKKSSGVWAARDDHRPTEAIHCVGDFYYLPDSCVERAFQGESPGFALLTPPRHHRARRLSASFHTERHLDHGSSSHYPELYGAVLRDHTQPNLLQRGSYAPQGHGSCPECRRSRPHHRRV